MSKARYRLDSAKGRLPDALRTLQELRQAVIAGEPDPVLLGLLDTLTDQLHGLEDAVGCLAPASLFSPLED